MYPPYKGILYTSANYQRVKKMYDDLFVIEVSKKAEIEEKNNTVYTNVQNSSFAKYGGMEAELMTIDLMEGHDFEHWCAGALKEMGFSNVEVTPASGDHGVDVLAQKDGIKYAIQCKRYSHDLGNTPIQEVHAGKSMYNCHVGVVITNQHFTAGAKQLAQATGVLLWDREWIKSHLESVDNSIPAQSNHNSPYEDEMFPAAVDIILETKQASVSMLQHRLKLGYARAARLVDELEEKGIIGPFQGSKPRTILITKEEWDVKTGKHHPIETPIKVQNRVTPDLDPAIDHQQSTVMVEFPEPSPKNWAKYLSLFLCWFQLFLMFLKVSIRGRFWDGGTASIITFIITVVIFPLLLSYLCVWRKYEKKKFYSQWWFWIIFCLIALSM